VELQKEGGLRMILLLPFILRTKAPQKRFTGKSGKEDTVGDKGGKKDKDKGQKQKATQQAKNLKQKKDKEAKSSKK
jgi:hypothetical protein